jgi:rare lipoprotein A
LRSSFRPRRLRVAQLTIVATLFALPASAFAFAGNTAAESAGHGALPIRVAPAHVRAGRPVHVTGTSQQAAGARVLLQARIARRTVWRTLQTTTVAASGRFAFTAHLRHSGLVRVVSAQATQAQSGSAAPPAGTPGAASVAVGSTASAKRIKVTADVLAHQADRAVLDGGRVTVRGRVLPVARSRRVALQGHSRHGWTTLTHGRTGATGRYKLSYHATIGTNRMLRVLFAGDAANARASAAAGTVTVYQPAIASWYYDAGLQTGCGFNARYGVANKTLPCGTKVQLRYGGRTVMATVDDRGPYVAGRTWDLGQSTRAALGFNAGVGTVWASVR